MGVPVGPLFDLFYTLDLMALERLKVPVGPRFDLFYTRVSVKPCFRSLFCARCGDFLRY